MRVAPDRGVLALGAEHRKALPGQLEVLEVVETQALGTLALQVIPVLRVTPVQRLVV
jgi:hypothetical protein